MADSDSDYIASSGDEAGGGGGGGGGPARRGGDRAGGGGGRGAGKGGGKRAAKPRERERWEEVQRAWDVGLDDDVSIESTVAELLEAGKKRRYLPFLLPLLLVDWAGRMRLTPCGQAAQG